MLGLNLALSLWTSIKSWLPSAWFTNNEQGVWYDPSDFSTMFQDSAGITPVTAVEQPVGLVLDKSKGLVLRPELVTNGDFSNGTTGWSTYQATIAVSAGELSVTTTALPGGQSFKGFTTVAEKWYVATCTLRNSTGTNVKLIAQQTALPYTSLAVSSVVAGTVNTVVSVTFKAISDNSLVIPYVTGAIGSVGVFDNISVRELPGNHATQATSTKRPVLSARVNLLTKTEDFGDAAWVKQSGLVSVTANSAIAPNGMMTADLATWSGYASLYQAIPTPPSGTPFIAIIWMKGTAGETINFSPDVGTVHRTKITLNGEWQKATFSGVAGPNTGTNFAVNKDATTTATSVYIWGASLVPADQASLPYQRVNTATDYDTVGFKPYLKFDGVDDALVTSSIDFTATDKMTVVAGVRKLSDAALGIICEISSSAAANSGAFYIATFTDATYKTNHYVSTDVGAVSPVIASPDSSVITHISSFSPPSILIRKNKIASSENTISAGTGNFGNYPLYIGSRGGTSLPFNGHLYSLIVRGAQSTGAQIVSAETYVNSKTGAY